jgi:hypothetical protein
MFIIFLISSLSIFFFFKKKKKYFFNIKTITMSSEKILCVECNKSIQLKNMDSHKTTKTHLKNVDKYNSKNNISLDISIIEHVETQNRSEEIIMQKFSDSEYISIFSIDPVLNDSISSSNTSKHCSSCSCYINSIMNKDNKQKLDIHKDYTDSHNNIKEILEFLVLNKPHDLIF